MLKLLIILASVFAFSNVSFATDATPADTSKPAIEEIKADVKDVKKDVKDIKGDVKDATAPEAK